MPLSIITGIKPLLTKKRAFSEKKRPDYLLLYK
jgi:hypothetical protein